MKSPVLRFPDDQSLGRLDVVAVFEPHRGVFGERTVADLERGTGLRQLLKRREPAAVVPVVEDGVTVAEGAALDVFTRETNRHAVGQDGRERELLGGGPVHGAFGRRVEDVPPALARAFELAMDRESLGHGQEVFVQLAEPIERHGSLHASRRSRRGDHRRRLHVVLLGIERLEPPLQVVHPRGQHRVGSSRFDDAARFERPRPTLAHGRLLGHLPIHQRLGERRFVAFVVSVAAIADEIDQHVTLELRPVREREPRRGDRGFGIVGVDVDDRNLEAARQPARIERAAGVRGLCRESDLVVRDDVDRPSGRVAGQTMHVQGLGDDPLSRKRGVAVDQDGQDGIRIERGRAAMVRLGARRACHALEHRVDRLEMARVRRHRDDESDRLPAADGA